MNNNQAPIGEIVEVDPARCRMWSLHDRMEDFLTKVTCWDVIKSVRHQGQIVPALGRPVSGEVGIDVELIFGARRLFAARYLNRKLKVDLAQMDDQTALKVMFAENNARADVSPYERGIAFRRWLRDGHFESQQSLATSIGVSEPTVSRLLCFASLPAAVISAFTDPREMREDWAIQLMRKCKDDHSRRLLIDAARRLQRESSRRGARDVLHYLLAAGNDSRKTLRHDRVVRHRKTGQPIFRVRETEKTLAFIFPSDRISKRTMDDLIESNLQVLEFDSHGDCADVRAG
jgi:ParB family chromosome partitioning protein